MADNTIASMINRALGKAKVYGNNANHPGHTTAAFNKMKVPVGNALASDRPMPLQPLNAPPPDKPEPDPLTPLD